MKKISLLLIVFCVVTVSSLNAQRFTEDSVKFIKELNAYFQEFSADKKEAAKWVDDFEEYWKSPDFTKDYKSSVYKMANAMAAKKLKPTPYFKNFLTAVSNYIDNKMPYKDYGNWITSVEKVMSGKGTHVLDDYLEMSVNLFTNNSFYKSPTYEWQSDRPKYIFDFDSLPKVVFPELTLRGLSPRGDTIEINKTKGVYYPTSGRFYGNGGKVSWERTGLGPEVYADINRYTIICKTGEYTADSVIFYYNRYLDKPQKGKVNDKIITERENPTYPRFDSYSKRLIVKNVAPDVDFDGGFAMRGDRFVGSGDANNPARLLFKRNNEPFLVVSAKNFSMAQDKVSSPQAAIKFILQKDSIIHPGLSFKYIVDQKKISLIRTDDGLQRTPFYSSFHKMDIYVEEMTWKLDEPKVEMSFIAGNFQGEAYFESEDFFVPERVKAMQGLEGNNPIFKVNEYYEKYKKKTFTTDELAIYLKWLSENLRPILIKMATFGLIYYDPATDKVTIKDKLFNYLKAYKKSRDYDKLTVHSVNPGNSNATLNLVNDNYDLWVHGVNSILLSDSQQVFVFPKKGEVTIKKNRDLVFQGVIGAGKFEFHGKDFYYSYEKNKIDLRNVDSLRIYVDPFQTDELAGTGKMRRVETVLENINGELSVDHPSSHSGRLAKPEYPIFKSFKECYAFYDRRGTQRGVYKRDKFYFKLDPFTIDSLDNFTNEQLEFGGEFVSAGIFPQMRETLKIQKDYSLGFITKTPPGGYPVYGGLAKFDNEIRLSNKGLSGDGTIEFGPSTSKSDNFIYFPDSMNGIAKTFDIKETETPDEFPQAHGDDVYLHWMPYKDLMQAFDRKTQFSSYNEEAKFHGRYDLSKSQLTGRGKVEFEKADLMSKNILFKRRKFFSDTADFHLKAFDEEGFTFSTDNVNSTIDFEKRTGTFISNGKGSLVRFDKNQYICYMDRFKWFMDQEDIELGDEKNKIEAGQGDETDLKIEGPEFISIHPKQDSLRFYSPAAKYNLRKYIISCINVPFINVADARFFPDSGKVTLFKNAVMDTLRNAVLLANTVSKFHNIKEVKANIYGKRSYLASGKYTYFDENDRPFIIHFATIKPDTTGQTISEGVITEKDNFRFNDFFSFAGKVFLVAPNQYLFFEGGTRMVHNCSRIGKSYLQFSGEIDPKEIFIPIPKSPVDVNGATVVNAIMYAPDTSGVYSGFISPKSTRNDKEIITSSGFLTFDKPSGQYRISNREKLEEQNLPGNYLSLDTTTCTVYGEGVFDIGADLGQVESKTVGSATHYSINDSAVINLMATINFYFEDKALGKLAADLEVYLNSFPATDFNDESYLKGLTELMGKEKAEKSVGELQVNGEFKRFPDELEKSFFFNDLTLIYDGKKKAFRTTGSIGVGNVLKTEINRKIPGMVAIEKKRSGGDALYIYFELDNQTWYYFEYFKGVMKAVSSNKEFNEAISAVKPKKRKKEVDKGPAYQYTTAPKSAPSSFIRKFGFKR